jgi:hypothetical protein
MDALLLRSEVGLLPADSATREWFSKLKVGKTVVANVSAPRNPLFHRKFFALLQYAFEHWSETNQGIEYKGQMVQPDFERFRKDITILAGRYRPVVNIKGEVRVEADSISFARMNAEDFEKLYSQVIQVLLTRVFTASHWNEQALREVVEGICEFAA